MVKQFLLAVIRVYQRAISPMMPPACRFTPTCSEYMYQAVTKYGALHGFWMGLKRLVRCNPFCPGGYDPVP
ncbi:MAG: membrane protein insertion efficiency factor YidD [Anaerolineae bacterium]